MSEQQKELILTAFRDTLASKADDSIDWASMREVLKACDPAACTDDKLEILLQSAVSQQIADSTDPTARVKLEPFINWLLGGDKLTAGPSIAAKSVVLVGYGPIGHGVIKRLLEIAAGNIKITVVCEEPHAAYNRVKLTSYFQHRTHDKIAYSTPEWCVKSGVKLVFGKAASIDRGAKKVDVDLSQGGSEVVSYDDLVLATGSKPFIPPAPAGFADTKGIFVYRTINDCQAIIDYAKTAKKAAVIGGGLLGLEAAKAVYDLGLQVDVIEFAPVLLGVQIDAEAGAIVKQKVESLGVKVHTSCKTLEILKDASGAVSGLKIEENGAVSELEVAMVIVSAGVRPRQELAEACGLKLGPRGGVEVDEKMRSTTDQNVWAVGECASAGGMCYGLVAPGFAQAEVLVSHLTNPSSTEKYTGSDLSTKLKLMGVDVSSFGGSSDFWFGGIYRSTDESKVKCLVEKDGQAGNYKKLVFSPDGKKLLGGILVGAPAIDFPKLATISKKPDLGGLTPEDIMAGASPKVDDGGDGTNLAATDNVCNCHSVQKWIIERAIKEGAESFQAIRDKTRAGTGCGGCIAVGPMPKILANTLRKLGRNPGVCAAIPFSKEEIVEIAKTRQLKEFNAFAWQVCPLFEKMTPEEQEEARVKVTPILEESFSGKAKGDGMSHVEQLKALWQDLYAFTDKMNCDPIMVRLAWHDSGTYDKRITNWPECGGANGSIRFKPEIDHGANNGLSKAVGFLAPFKNDYPLVSWADLIQMGSAVAIEHAGGPKIAMKYGRQDAGPEACPGRQSRGTGDNAGLPDAEAPFGCGADSAAQHLRTIFYRMGFDDKGIVALSGAHTLGRAFKERSGLVENGYGEEAACPFTKAIGICPVRRDGKAGVGMPGGKSWTKKWLKFDNEYFTVYKEQNADLIWFPTDKALHTDDGFTPHFRKYAESQDAFFEDYKEAHKMLSELGSKFEPADGITID